MRGLFFLLEVTLAPWLIVGQCNVQSGDSDLFSSVLPGTPSSSNLKVTRFSSISSGEVELVDSSTPGVTGQAWFLEQQRVVDGFSLQASYQITDGDSDGFALVVQNDKITNVFASGSSNLGFKDGLDNYLAVAFDTCSNRVEDATCGVSQITILSKVSGEDPVELGSTTLTDDVVDQTFTFQVDFLQDVGDFGSIEVFFSGTERVAGNLTSDLEELLGSKFATVGITSSNSANAPATVTIRRLIMNVMNSGTKLEDGVPRLQQVIFGRVVSFSLVLVDSCDDLLSEEAAALVNVNESEIVATLTEDVAANPLVVDGTVTESSANRFLVSFTMPSNVLADWTLNISVQGVLVQGMPAADALTTNEPDNGGLSQQGIIMLICLIAVLVVITVYMVRRLDYFRKKLKEHEEDIDYGRVKAQVDEIDRTIEYQMNPMIAPLEEMQEKLDRNLKMLEQMRSGQENAMDSNYTVDQLVAENERLRAEMNRLKKEEQMAEAGNRAATQGRRKLGGGGGNRQDFDQERV